MTHIHICVTFEVKDGDKDKNNKLMSFRISDGKLLEKYKAIWTKIEDLKTWVKRSTRHDDIYIKTKIRTYDDKVYTNFRGLKVPEDDIKRESFTVIFIKSLLAFETKYYLQVYLGNSAHKIADKQMIDK